MTTLACPGAATIDHSRWSVGGETLDRGYADYHAYRDHLGPLGVKRIRLQAGWARCEQTIGQYDFAWLDAIVDDARAQGIQPWLELSYGNPLYADGGTAALAGGIPTGADALLAWDAWVQALVAHFADRVTEWEIWNEPDISQLFDAEAFAGFYLRTARAVRAVQPSAQLIAMSLASPDRHDYIDALLGLLQAEGATDLIDVISYHGYSPRPEDIVDRVAGLRAAVDAHMPGLPFWQGETGAPSGAAADSVGALTHIDWTETSQAKWYLRRMAAELMTDAEVISLFQISDMRYAKGDHLEGWNCKGLLLTDQQHQVVSRKRSWFAVRHLVHLLSGDLTRRADVSVQGTDDELMSVAVERQGLVVLLYWQANDRPTDSDRHDQAELTIAGHVFKEPLLVDPLTGSVEAVDLSASLPLYDAPLVIVDAAWLEQ